MKLRNFQIFIASFISVLSVVAFVVWNTFYSYPPTYSFKVKIPQAFDPNFSDDDFATFCLNNAEIIPISAFKKFGWSCFDSMQSKRTLLVSIDSKRNLKINSLEVGNIGNPLTLTEKLKTIFNNREEEGIFELNSNEIHKTVVVRAPLSAKYIDVIKVIDAVKSSGADPIALQIDDLPNS